MKLSILLMFGVWVATTISVLAEDDPPKAPVHEVEDEYWGIKIKDPYRWMENIKQDPEAQQWLKAQADFTMRILDSMPGYGKLKARITELVNSEPATISRPHLLANGNLFYLKTAAGQNTAKLCFRKSVSADEVILVNPDEFGKQDGKPHAINFYAPAMDGSHVAFGISAQGSENAFIHVVETATGKEAQVLRGQTFQTGVIFSRDGKALVTADSIGTLRLWDIAGGKELRRFGVRRPPNTPPSRVSAMVWSPAASRRTKASNAEACSSYSARTACSSTGRAAPMPETTQGAQPVFNQRP